MDPLEAQGEAARLIKRLRDAVRRFDELAGEIHRTDTEVLTLMPALTPDARRVVEAVRDTLSEQIVSTLMTLLEGKEAL